MTSYELSWLRVVEVGNTGKTSIYEVRTKDPEPKIIGHIKWFGQWRKYTLFPTNDSIYEPTCLNEIADLLRKLMNDRKIKNNVKRSMFAP